MKVLVRITCFIFLILFSCNNNVDSRKVENIKAFAKLYGYVRWFHPSDEAQKIDWDKFACHGVKTVESAPNSEALIDSLIKLFLPVAPSLQISFQKNLNYDISQITPKDSLKHKLVYWHHSGVALNNTMANAYSSLRVNRLKIHEYKNIPAIFKRIDASRYVGKIIELSFELKTNGIGQANILFDGLNREEYFNISKNNSSVSFQNLNWEKKTLRCKINPDDITIMIAFNELAGEDILIKNICITEINDETGNNVIFKSSLDDYKSDDFQIKENMPFEVRTIPVGKSDNCLAIHFNSSYNPTAQGLKFGELINEKIHPELSIALPISLLASETNTFPVSNPDSLRLLNMDLNKSFSRENENIASLLITWNVMQHFFPYFDEIDIDWEKEFERALYETYQGEDFKNTFQKFTAKLKDGHVRVYFPSKNSLKALPLKWEWIEGELVVTEVYDESIDLLPGTIIKKIENQKAKKYFADIEQYLPSPTMGFLKYKSQYLSLQGSPDKEIILDTKSPDGKRKKKLLSYSMPLNQHFGNLIDYTKFKVLDNNIVYLNLDKIPMTEIDFLLPEILNSKGLICDLRGYPYKNQEILNHLLVEKDTVSNWLKIPQVRYPNRHKMEFIGKGWQLKPKSPQFTSPTVFITDGRAMSWAESILLIVKHYNLATIIGQPSGGTNGDINSMILPNGSHFYFTGTKVTNFDGSQHFNIGVLPDIYVERTISGIREGKDEFLLKAIEILNENKMNN